MFIQKKYVFKKIYIKKKSHNLTGLVGAIPIIFPEQNLVHDKNEWLRDQ